MSLASQEKRLNPRSWRHFFLFSMVKHEKSHILQSLVWNIVAKQCMSLSFWFSFKNRSSSIWPWKNFHGLYNAPKKGKCKRLLIHMLLFYPKVALTHPRHPNHSYPHCSGATLAFLRKWSEIAKHGWDEQAVLCELIFFRPATSTTSSIPQTRACACAWHFY